MKMTRHAMARIQQRGFSALSLDIIQQYGRCENAPGGAMKFFFGEREYQSAVGNFKNMIQLAKQKQERNRIRRNLQLLDRAKGGKIIVKDGSIVTMYK